MYEGFYGLSKRPFSAVPRPDSFVALESVQEALDALLTCITQSRGIAVVTSPAGLGKTLLCKRLAEIAETRFQSVYLSTSAFSTRRAMLQAVLYEFGIDYEGLSEQEARLKIMEAARAIANDGKQLLIIIDEAHLLNHKLFEELRTLTDYAPAGEVLIQLVLSGQFELEEKLADPAMSAINQRIGCQVCLEPLSLEDSARLLTERLQGAGARNVASLLTTDALEAMCRASDGNPRCLCQLADHSFLLGYAEEVCPINRETVVAALHDLKELPLHWNDLPIDATSFEQLASGNSPCPLADAETEEFEIPQEIQALHASESAREEHAQYAPSTPLEVEKEMEKEVAFSVLEVGAEIGTSEPEQRETDTTGRQGTAPAEAPSSSGATGPSQDDCPLLEEPIFDKYAELDRWVELPEERRATQAPSLSGASSEPTPAMQPVQAIPATIAATPLDALDTVTSLLTNFDMDEATFDETEPSSLSEQDILETVDDLRREIGHAVDTSRDAISRRQMDHDFDDWLHFDIVQPDAASRPVPVEQPSSKSPSAATPNLPEVPERRFAQLFTRLRQRRQAVLRQKRS